MNALVSPSSLVKAQLLSGSHTPATGAYPEGPPISDLVNHKAKSCLGAPSGIELCNLLFQLLTLVRDFLEWPGRTIPCFLCSYRSNLVTTNLRLASSEGSWYMALTYKNHNIIVYRARDGKQWGRTCSQLSQTRFCRRSQGSEEEMPFALA